MRRVNLFRHFRLDYRQCRTYSQGRLFSTQQVRLKRPWFRRFATTCLVYGAAFHLWTSLVYLQFDSEVTQGSAEDHVAQKNGATDELNPSYSEEEGEDTSFIPLSWPLLRKGELYTPTDPEWLVFCKYASDKKCMNEIQDQLLKFIGNRVLKSNHLNHLLGGPLTIDRHWLQPFFPYRAPPYYQRYGLEISDNEVAVILHTMRSEDGDRIWKALYPITVAKATYHAMSVLLAKKWQRIRKSFNETDVTSRNADRILLGTTYVRFPSGFQRPKRYDFPEFSEWEAFVTHQTETDPSANENPTRQFPDNLPPLMSILKHVPFPDFSQGSDMYAARSVFMHDLHRDRLKRRVPNRGVFYFNGILRVSGSKGCCRMEVRGEYDPAEGKFSKVSLLVRDMSFAAQEAIGTAPRYDQGV